MAIALFTRSNATSCHQFGTLLRESCKKSVDEKGCPNVFSVNGPPGTGKTTLLKDIIALYVHDRAYYLAQDDSGFDKVFPGSPVMVTCKDEKGESQIPVYLFAKPKDFRRFGILVCSSNNAAVENISLELPDLENLDAKYAKDSYCLREDYYRQYATNLLRTLKNNEVSKAWGLIAVPLGKYDNLTAFLSECLTPFNAREQLSREEIINRKHFLT